MKTKEALAGLERECAACGVKLTYDELLGEGGLCRAYDKYHIIINKRASAETRIRIIREGLAEVRRRVREAAVSEGAGSVTVSVVAQEHGPADAGGAVLEDSRSFT